MRKVELNMTEDFKYKVIKKLVETKGNKKRASLTLDCTIRTIDRMIAGYKKIGKEFFSHGNKNKKPAHALEQETIDDIVSLYNTKYYDANFQYFSELLEEYENIKVSPTTISNILKSKDIISPKARRATKKKIKEKLEEKKKSTKSKKEIDEISKKIVDIEDVHPRRPRSAFFGEMVQMDASVHEWFGGKNSYLHIAIDDATGEIIGAYFDHQETLKGYYNVFHQILTNHGIPYMFYTDRRTVFEYKKKNSPSIEKDTFTQFGYACQQLGVDIKTTSIPQAKGRVERLFLTLQSRLPIELRLQGITEISSANEFLNSYIKKFNKRFSVNSNNIKSVFENQPKEEEINLTLAVLSKRTIDNGHAIKFKNNYYKPMDSSGNPVYYYKGTPANVIEAFNGEIYACIKDKVYVLDIIPKHQKTSKNFDFNYSDPKPKKRKIPNMNHPWRIDNFTKFVKKQKHRHDMDFEDISYSQAVIDF